MNEVAHSVINEAMQELAKLGKDDPVGPHHYEFVFNPYDKRKVALQAVANKVAFDTDRPSVGAATHLLKGSSRRSSAWAKM